MKLAKKMSEEWLRCCKEDPFIAEVVDEEPIDDRTPSYITRDGPKLFSVADSIKSYMANNVKEFQWHKDVWSPVLERKSDIPDGSAIDWDKQVNLITC